MKNINENPLNVVIFKIFSASISFSVSFEIIRVIQIKKTRIHYLFIALIYFPLSIQMNILTLYNNFHIIFTTYMLDSALEPSYNLSKIFYYCHGN